MSPTTSSGTKCSSSTSSGATSHTFARLPDSGACSSPMMVGSSTTSATTCSTTVSSGTILPPNFQSPLMAPSSLPLSERQQLMARLDEQYRFPKMIRSLIFSN